MCPYSHGSSCRPHRCAHYALQAEQLLAQRAAAVSQPASVAAKPPPHAEYAQLRLRHEFVARSERDQLPPAINLFEGIERLPAVAVARMRRLERDLFDGQQPAMDDEQLAKAAAELAEFEILRLRTSLMRGAQQVLASSCLPACWFLLLPRWLRHLPSPLHCPCAILMCRSS